MKFIHRQPRAAAGNLRMRLAAFTLVEAMVTISILGIGVASTVGALTQFNSIASISRNASGACTAVVNQIDLIQSDGPFNPQKTNPDGTAQIPQELQLGTRTQQAVLAFKISTTGVLIREKLSTT